MSEQDWLASEDPAAMLSFVTGHMKGDSWEFNHHRPSDRKLRLFACACCRQVWHLLTDDRSRRAMEVAERFADGEASQGRLQEAFSAAHAAATDAGYFTIAWLPFYACDTRLPPVSDGRRNLLAALRNDCVSRTLQSALLREIVGNPFQVQPIVWHDGVAYCSPRKPTAWPKDPGRVDAVMHGMSWLCCHWLTPQVLSLAQAAYDERPGRQCGACKGSGETDWWGDDDMRTDHKCPGCNGTGRIEDGTLDPLRLAILADVLEEAGCEDDAILLHLRSPGPHVRGCWALDLILGKS